jgi:hypothetical protein
MFDFRVKRTTRYSRTSPHGTHPPHTDHLRAASGRYPGAVQAVAEHPAAAIRTALSGQRRAGAGGGLHGLHMLSSLTSPVAASCTTPFPEHLRKDYGLSGTVPRTRRWTPSAATVS